jgi:hypothetical protein
MVSVIVGFGVVPIHADQRGHLRRHSLINRSE